MISLPKTCLGCPLYDSHKGFSALEGDGSSGLMVIAESLGRAEEKDGLPLRPRAPSGGVFQKAINTSGLTELRRTATITNTIRCKAEAPYPREALDHCRQYLDAAIAERKPRFILALGDVPLQELSLTKGTQAELRGFVLPSRYSVPMLASFHPSRIARGDWKLFGILMQDIRRADSFARKGIPERRQTQYIIDPTTNQIRDYIERLRSDITLPISYDTETPELIGEKSNGKTIMLMQFSSEVGTGMALTVDRMDAAKVIMALGNPKWGWADRTFDRALLRANGFTLNGELHDLMNAHAHLQSGLMSTKDETSGEKNIPAKLMSLQSCTSLYFPWERPWKRMVKDFMEANPEASHDELMTVVKQYGCIDVDTTLRDGLKLFAALRSGDLYDGYYEHKFRFSFVLDDLHDTGLPVDRGRQEKVRTQIQSEDARLLRELQSLVPEELQALHPEFGYVNVPSKRTNPEKPSIQEIIDNGYDATSPPLIELGNTRGYLTQRMVTADVINKVEVECVECEGVGTVAGVRKPKKCAKCKGYGWRSVKDGRISRDELRWALALFNPNSSQHIIAYLKYRDYPIPLHIDTKRPTTGQKEIEALIDDTDDEALKVVSKIKKLTKLGGTYCGGDWVPGEDGRVHGTFRFGTASGQTSCTAPNQQQWPSHSDPDDEWLVPIMAQIKSCIRAEPGHVFVKIDAKGAHSRQQAWLAEDSDYYRLANLGSHAFVTAHYVGVPDKDRLLQMDDVALLKRLNEIKKQYDYEYNFAKRVSFNMQYLGGAQKAAHTLRVPVMQVVELMDMIKNRIFPKSFNDYPRSVARRLKQHPRLVSAHKACRWIWDGDEQQAVAFSVASEFHAHWQSGLVRLREKGLTRRFPLTNFCHDDAWFHVLEADVDDCIAECRTELEKPSTVLVNSLGHFQVNTEVQVGYDMLNLRDV
jgi:uracil-DNA glycosylase family 4